MFRMTAATRITFGLVCSMMGVLIAANYFKLLPDEESTLVSNRVQIVESLAFTSAPIIEAGQINKLQAVLSELVNRHSGSGQLRSAGVRNSSGELIVDAGNHAVNWPTDIGAESTPQFMQVKLSARNEVEWGLLEVAFTPIRPSGFFGYFQNSMSRLMLFCAPVAFFSFRWFLTMVLKNLDPSQAVPRRVREALDILSEGLMIVGTNGRILLANKATEAMVGYQENKLVGVKAGDLKFTLIDATGDPLLPWDQALKEVKSVSNVMMQLPSLDGNCRVFRVNCSPLSGSDGENRGVMVTFDDVTELEKQRGELKVAKDDAEAANKAKSDFLANMSHEIRNPMNAIVGFTDILRRGMEDSEETRRSYLNTIHASGNHLVGLINDILDLSKIESGKMELEICECNPYQLMSEVVSVLQMKADDEGLLLEFEIEGSIPNTIKSDPTRLRQILMNLVGNAIKFTQKGGVRIVARQISDFDQPLLEFRVIDTGIGMTEEQCGRIFEEFVQADSSVTRRFGGTGLGLAISKRLTEALGGQVSVTSVPDQGTTFTFTVAIGNVANAFLVDNEQASISLKSQQAEVATPGRRIRFKPARVLVTDDTPANRQLVGLVLRKAGLEVEEAENGLEAFERATSESFDLLLMDMQMPIMDGFTATRNLREHGLTVPIYALTANVMQADRDRCEAAGCTGFLTKPIDIDRLLVTLTETLEVDDSEPVALPPQPIVSTAISETPTERPQPSRPVVQSIDEVMEMVDRALATPASPAQPVQEPLISALPMEIPEFREIVTQFATGLPGVLKEMRTHWENRDFLSLRELAHKLKGTGGTVGFPAFTAPAGELQDKAEAQNPDGIEELLDRLEQLAAALQLPSDSLAVVESVNA